MNKILKSFLSLLCAGVLFLAVPVTGYCHAATGYTPVADTTMYVSKYTQNKSDIIWNCIPESDRKMLAYYNVSIYCMDGKHDSAEKGTSTTWYPTYNADGSVRSNMEIEVFVKNDPYGMNAKENVLHEVGHMVSYYYLGGYLAANIFDYAAKLPEWQRIYAADRKKMEKLSSIGDDGFYTSAEGFAEAYMIYILYPDKLQKASPDAFNFFSTIQSWIDATF